VNGHVPSTGQELLRQKLRIELFPHGNNHMCGEILEADVASKPRIRLSLPDLPESPYTGGGRSKMGDM